jgi:hypothetical protein
MSHEERAVLDPAAVFGLGLGAQRLAWRLGLSNSNPQGMPLASPHADWGAFRERYGLTVIALVRPPAEAPTAPAKTGGAP